MVGLAVLQEVVFLKVSGLQPLLMVNFSYEQPWFTCSPEIESVMGAISYIQVTTPFFNGIFLLFFVSYLVKSTLEVPTSNSYGGSFS